jgi:phosphoglycolate phosphatase
MLMKIQAVENNEVMTKKYLLFDIDGTLINSGGAGKKAMTMAFQKYLGKGALIDGYAFAGKTDSQIIKEVVIKAGTEEAKAAEIIEKIKECYITNLKDSLGEATNFRVYPHVWDIVEACDKSSRFELALLTGNFQTGAKLKLQHVDLWKYFKWGVFGDISEERNDLAEMAYKTIQEREGNINRKDIVVIGDTSNDVRCGQAISATTVGIVSGFETESQVRSQNPDFLIHSFKELINLWKL